MLQIVSSTPVCGEIKMKVVENNEENIAICKQFCGPCPTFKPNGLNTVKPNMLFCSRGQSEKPVEEIEEKGCICFGCPSKSVGLSRNWSH